MHAPPIPQQHPASPIPSHQQRPSIPTPPATPASGTSGKYVTRGVDSKFVIDKVEGGEMYPGGLRRIPHESATEQPWPAELEVLKFGASTTSETSRVGTARRNGDLVRRHREVTASRKAAPTVSIATAARTSCRSRAHTVKKVDTKSPSAARKSRGREGARQLRQQRRHNPYHGRL